MHPSANVTSPYHGTPAVSRLSSVYKKFGRVRSYTTTGPDVRRPTPPRFTYGKAAVNAAGGLGNYKSAGLDILGIALLNQTDITWAKVERAVPPFTMGNFVRTSLYIRALTMDIDDLMFLTHTHALTHAHAQHTHTHTTRDTRARAHAHAHAHMHMIMHTHTHVAQQLTTCLESLSCHAILGHACVFNI